MDEFVRKAVARELPAVMLLVIMGTTGLFGAAAITTASFLYLTLMKYCRDQARDEMNVNDGWWSRHRCSR
ncbi:MAG: hypothetical protein DSM106950_38550 [Stigonema ocellatum SAG 48.90 = DSM 106950]|nr:hypothetical protein [Stigonema ocellatum SAG 48.90 = DSM 106950]